MDYNTSRKKLIIPEYGRHVQEMVEHLKTIEDKDERNKNAKAVIQIMGNLMPHLRDIQDFKHKLWDQLFIMADFDLDIDSPYELPTRETIQAKPDRLPYNETKVRFKHYGRSIEMMITKAIEFEEGEEKEALISIILNHMKKSYLHWNSNAVRDKTIIKEFNILSNGKIVLDEKRILPEARELMQRNRRPKRFTKSKSK